jgi:hypothetical protein
MEILYTYRFLIVIAPKILYRAMRLSCLSDPPFWNFDIAEFA